jgi:hypothetical protein
MTTIAFDRDRYGNLARGSLVADFVEACAWKYGRYQIDEIEGLLRRMGRTRARDAFAFGPAVGEDEYETVDDDASDDFSATDVLEEGTDSGHRYVFALLKERQATLTDRYPFAVDGTAVTWKKGPDTVYDSLLAITLAHAFKIAVAPTLTAKTVEVLFEYITARCLQGKGRIVHNMGDTGRHAGNFPQAIGAASEALNWQLVATATPHKHSAQEEGCDTIVMFPWLDKRPGRLFLVGQSTLAMSEKWREKIAEPAPGAWDRRLQTDGMPSAIPFIAVPHHVEAGTLSDLQLRGRGMVIDRLRLACGEHSDMLSKDEVRVIAAVRDADVEV